MRRLGIVVCVLISVLAACAYPRRSTSLSPATGEVQALDAPTNVWRLRLGSATIPPRRRGGLDWDPDGGLPDAFVRILRGDELVFESPVEENTLDPSFDVLLPKNVWLPPDRELRIEVWDRDEGPSNDPIGVWRGQGLPSNALPDADARITLEGGAALSFRVMSPHPHRGVGIAEFEVRGAELKVLSVMEHSPASRAGIAAGDSIVAIGDRAVDDLDDAQAASALSMAADRQASLRVRKASGQEETVELDRGYVWLTM